MKFSEIPYERPDVEALKAHMTELTSRLASAADYEAARQAWDELEKSVVAHVADDVKVSIRGSVVEMTIFKKFA